jgi:predicted nucleic acid-binding protein
MPGGRTPAIVDTGPLYAVADADDHQHERCLAVLARRDLRLILPALVVAGASYLMGKYLGPVAEARFLASLSQFEVMRRCRLNGRELARSLNSMATSHSAVRTPP